MAKTLLHLIQEYATLNEAKTLAGGRLPESKAEARWAELKDFYGLLMAQDGLCAQPASRFTAGQIRETISTRKRLRVHTDMEIVADQAGSFQRAKVANLSCGGVLLLCDEGLSKEAPLTLHLANVARGDGVLPTEGRIVWQADSGQKNGTFRYRMGIQFLGVGPAEERSLDTFVVDSLENKLLSLSREALDEDFLRREDVRL